MRLIGEEEAKRRGLDRLFYGSDPMVMEEPASITPGEGVREREEGLRAAFDAAAASGIMPERAREDLRLSRSSGIPFYMINESERVRNSALLEEHRRACRESFARAARVAPVTSRFLSDPGRMLAAGGDVERLTEAEGLIGTALRAHRAGAAQAELSQLLGKVAAWGDGGAETAARIEELRREVEEIGNAPDSGFANWLWSAVNTLPQWERQWASGGGYGAAVGAASAAAMALKAGAFIPFPEEVATVPAALVWGGSRGFAAGALKASFEMEAGAAYDEFRSIPGVDDAAARTAAVASGVLNSGLDVLGASTFIESFPGGRAALNKVVGRAALREALTDPTVAASLAAFGKRYAKGLTLETAQEMVQEVVTILVGRGLREYSGAEQEPLAADAARVAETGIESFKGFSLMMLPGPTTRLARDLNRVRTGRSTYNVLTETAKANDTLAASDMGPDTAKEFTAEAMKGTEVERVFIPGQAIVTLNQSGHIQNYDEFLSDTLGVSAKTVEEAAELGNDVEVSGADLVALPQPLRDVLLAEAKANPEDLSESEARVVRSELEARRMADLNMAFVEADRLAEEDRSAKFVHDSVSAQLKLAAQDYERERAKAKKEGEERGPFMGGDAGAVAEQAASIMSAASKAAAREWSASGVAMSPRQWFENLGLSVSFGEARRGAFVFDQPVNAGVDLERKVHVTEISPTLNDAQADLVKQNKNKKAFASKLSGTYRNDDTGWDIHLSMSNVSHAVKTALSNEFGFANTVKILEGLPGLIKNAVLVESHDDVHQNEYVSKVHRMFAPARLLGDDSVYTVKLTVKEMDGRFLASVEGIYRAYDANVVKKISGPNRRPPVNKEPMNGQQPDIYEGSINEHTNSVNDGIEDSIRGAEKKTPYPISENQYDADSSSTLVPRRSLEEEAPAGQQPEFDTSERAADSVSENGNVTDGAADLSDTTLAERDGDVKDGGGIENSEATIKEAPYPISENQYKESARDAAAGLFEMTLADVLRNVKDNGGEPYLQDAVSGARGSIVFGERKVRGRDKKERVLPKIQITLSRDADSSTVFHEFGHLFFHDLARRAELPAASERTKHDFEILREWLGWDGEKQTEWTREQHEQFARGFEAYLFEGKAPSIELKGVFRRIRDWMVNIYRELRNLNVELSDDVRGVFDRLLATDAAIVEARVGLAIEQDNDFSMLDGDTKSAAKAAREEAFGEARDEAQSHILQEVTKKAQSDWRRAYKRLEPEVRREVASSGVYKHFEVMKQNSELRLSSAEFAERFGAEALAKLPDGVVSENGTDLDTAASSMGFASAEEMAGAFASARPFEEEVRARTEAAVAAKYPERVMTPENLEKLAEKVVLKHLPLGENVEKARADLRAEAEKRGLSEEDTLTELDRENQQEYVSGAERTRRRIHRALEEDRREREKRRRLEAELENEPENKKRFSRHKQEVADLRGGRARALKDAADAAIGQKVYTEAIRPSVYVAAAERARRNAVRSELNRDFDDAFRFRELEAINMAMAKSAREAADEAGEIRKYLLKFAKRDPKKSFGVAPEFMEQIDVLLDRFDLRRRHRKDEEAQRAPSLAKFAENLRQEGETLLIPESMLNEGFRKRFDRMTIAEIRDLRDLVRSIEHIGKNQNRLYRVKGMENVASAIKAICDRIAAYYKVGTDRLLNPAPDSELPKAQRSAKGAAAAMDSALNPMEFIIREIDGFEELGPMREFIYETINDADTQEEVLFKKKFEELHQIFVKYYGRDLKVTTPDGRRVAFADYVMKFDNVFLSTDRYDPEKHQYTKTDAPLELSFDRWIALVLNCGNEGNRQRLENWGFTEADLDAIVNAGTERDLEFIQEIWDYLETFKPMIQETHRILTGTNLRWVEATPIKTKFGTLRGGTGTLAGGYYPIVTDARYNERAASRQELEELLDKNRFSHSAAYAKQGFRKERQARVMGAPPKLDLSVLDNHVANVIHDACFSVALRDVQKIFRSKDVQNAIVNAVGAEKKEAINRWLQDAAVGKRINAVRMTPVEQRVQKTTANIASSTLGGSIVGPALQLTGYFPLIHRLGFVNFVYGVSRYMRHPVEHWRFAAARSGYLQKNMDSVRDSMVQQTRDVWSHRGKRDKLSRQITALSMSLFPMVQNLCNVPGWYMSYEVGMKKYRGDEKKAARYADMAISTTQGGGRFIDQTLAERANPWNRVLMMFWSWFRVQYGMQSEAFKRLRRERSFSSVVNLASYVFWVLLAQQMAEAFVRGEKPDDEDERGLFEQLADDPASGVFWMAKRAGLGALSAYPVVGPAASFIFDGGRFRISPVVSKLESSARVVRKAAEVIGEEGWNPTEWDPEDIFSIANGAAELYSLKNGVPIRRFVKLGEAFVRAADGEDAGALAWDVLLNRRLGDTEERR